MSRPLDRLEELVRLTEEQYSKEKLRARIQELTQAVRETGERHRVAQERVGAARAARQEILEQTRADERRLTEHEQRIRAFAEAKLDVATLRALAAEAAEEIVTRREATEESLREAERELAEAAAALQAASAALRAEREASSKIHPGTVFTTPAVAPAAATLDLPELDREVEELAPLFGSWTREEQLARMKLWIGRLRRIQAAPLGVDDDRRARRLFTRLVGLSKEYEPGYIEAFRQDFVADWDAFIEAAERSAQRLESERRDAEERNLAIERERAARERQASQLASARERLRGLLVQDPAPDMVVELVRELPTTAYTDTEILSMLAPWAKLFEEGAEFRPLRRNLQRLAEVEETETAPTLEPEVLGLTEGTAAAMIGGEPREAARRSIEAIFRFATLEWLPNSDAEAQRLEQRILARSVEWVLLPRSFISHTVADRIVAACKGSGVPFVLIEQGYGTARIAEAFRGRLRATRVVL